MKEIFYKHITEDSLLQIMDVFPKGSTDGKCKILMDHVTFVKIGVFNVCISDYKLLGVLEDKEYFNVHFLHVAELGQLSRSKTTNKRNLVAFAVRIPESVPNIVLKETRRFREKRVVGEFFVEGGGIVLFLAQRFDNLIDQKVGVKIDGSIKCPIVIIDRFQRVSKFLDF